MQYSFALPADYDMDIIDRRVAEKGHALDRHAPLIFKAYCVARTGRPAPPSDENLYAPFYLWKDTQGMNDFLCSAGFEALTRSFGWPSVKTWPLVLASEIRGIAGARFATRSVVQVAPFTPIGELGRSAQASAKAAIDGGAVAVVVALEAVTWTLVRFMAWSSLPDLVQDGTTQAYDVRHVSNPLLPQPSGG